ncbi:hypothetical protein CBW65_16295 [Tumebacillus avium]|uniref:Uncharacterized protein n=1 Tax=Tumebacillus avium TaxID=1903704 RepID=A0A1Y0IPD3_9BACL|nr:hypothetical protein [Tumebacillus avium]ARU62347.1 hypothetical protein CBW65_16295 [Tumebacillus avium]
MEDRMFYLIRDTVGIAGNLAELVGVIFLFTQFSRPSPSPSQPKTKVPVKRRTTRPAAARTYEIHSYDAQ